MTQQNASGRPIWSKADAKEIRQLTTHLTHVNAVAGVYDPSGGVVEEPKRLRYLELAAKLNAAMGAECLAWADAVAWSGKKRE
jgi:hypothetical protein